MGCSQASAAGEGGAGCMFEDLCVLHAFVSWSHAFLLSLHFPDRRISAEAFPFGWQWQLRTRQRAVCWPCRCSPLGTYELYQGKVLQLSSFSSAWYLRIQIQRFQPNMSVQPSVRSQSLQHVLSELEAVCLLPWHWDLAQPCFSLDCLFINGFCFSDSGLVQPLLKSPCLTVDRFIKNDLDCYWSLFHFPHVLHLYVLRECLDGLCLAREPRLCIFFFPTSLKLEMS